MRQVRSQRHALALHIRLVRCVVRAATVDARLQSVGSEPQYVAEGEIFLLFAVVLVDVASDVVGGNYGLGAGVVYSEDVLGWCGSIGGCVA